MARFDRTLALIGADKFNRLANSSVLVVGVGGVGGYCVEMLARVGIGDITLVDGDRVDETNINRQIIALDDTVARYKCDVFGERIKKINPSANLRLFNVRYNADTAEEILDTHYDYIVDAIDSVPDKVHLIVTAQSKGMKIVSAMGAGNRIVPKDFCVKDIYATSYDKLAKKMRKLLKDAGVTKHSVLVAESETVPCDGVIGSICYMPAIAGVKLAAFVINKLMEEVK